MLMNKIGRKNTVVLSNIITSVSLLLPIISNSYPFKLILLNIGNALHQTSLNPLMSLIVSGDKLVSNLTFGQFIKAFASFLALSSQPGVHLALSMISAFYDEYRFPPT